MLRPQFVWTDSHGTGRNVFALFRRAFKVSSVPSAAELHLFADTRYRLRVNGHVAAYGPARFTPKFPEYDSVDLAPFLIKGRNVVTVEVNSRGAGSFEHHASVGGFIAWGKVGAVEFSTPGAWKAKHLHAWDALTPPFSFAQGPTESVDLRRLPAEWFDADFDDAEWDAPVPLENQDWWGKPSPRSIPMLTLDERLPEKRLLVATLDSSETRIGCRFSNEAPGRGGPRPRACYATHLYSPEDQDVTLGLFWGPHFLNGEALKPVKNSKLGNREDFPVRLRKGWNFLCGEPEPLTAGWGMLIGFPSGKGIVASAELREDSPDVMLYSAPFDPEELQRARTKTPSCLEDLPDFPMRWTRVARNARPPLPAREVAWDTPGERAVLDPFSASPIAMPTSAGKDAVAVFDFGGEFLGHALIEIEAPAGTIVDIANDEHLRADGVVNVFSSHFMVNSADRFITRGGRETLEGFHPRGGRYLQISVRGANGPVTLQRVAIRQTTYPLKVEGRFACSDPLFNWVWSAGLQTLQACMEDAYTDCPWRERGCYLGDTLVEYHITRAATSDAALVRRCLWVFAKTQRDDGQMQDVAPACKDTVLHDYSLIWLILLRDYWAATGDKAFVADVWPSVERLFASPAWVETESGLLNADALHLFIDWSAPKETKKGESAPLNAYRAAALSCAAELAGVIGKRAEATRYSNDAARAKKSFQTLWDARHRRFAPARVNGEFLDSSALHANLLALHFGLAEKTQIAPVMEYLVERIAHNHKREPGHIDAYFFYFLLNVFYQHGRAAEAEQAMRLNYGIMRDKNAWTLWEYFADRASLCHAWSGAALHAFSQRTLGVRQSKPGNPDEIIVAPDSASLTWARGSVPHRLGAIDVEWRLRGERLQIEVHAPKGVRVKVQPAGVLAEKTPDVRIQQTKG